MPGLCPEHGPFDEDVCPYCSGYRPPSPRPLDDAPTDLRGAAGYQGGYVDGDAPTDLGQNARGRRGGKPIDDATEISNRRAGNRGPVDYNEEEVTDIGKSRIDDHTEIEMVITGPLGILWVSRGNRRGQIYNIKNGTVVGRKKGSLLLDDLKISDTHAKFTVEDGEFYLWDFGSTNGTYVNGERIRGATMLHEGDEIKMGDLHFVLKVLQDPERKAPRPAPKTVKRTTATRK